MTEPFKCYRVEVTTYDMEVPAFVCGEHGGGPWVEDDWASGDIPCPAWRSVTNDDDNKYRTGPLQPLVTIIFESLAETLIAERNWYHIPREGDEIELDGFRGIVGAVLWTDGCVRAKVRPAY